MSESSNITIPHSSTSNVTNTYYRTKFEYQLYVSPCLGSSIQPAGFVGSADQPTITPPVAEDGDWCQWYPAQNRAYTFTRSTATTFSSGVDIAGWTGFNLSSQTGYSSTAAASYLLNTPGWSPAADGTVPASRWPGSRPGCVAARAQPVIHQCERRSAGQGAGNGGFGSPRQPSGAAG